MVGRRVPNWQRRWIPIGLSWLGWCVLFGLLHSAASRIAFEYNINGAILWPLLGPPESIYSFVNLALPRAIANISVSIPAFLFGLLIYRTCSLEQKRSNLAGMAVVLATSTGFAMVSRPSADAINAEIPGPGLSRLFLLFLLLLTVVSGWLLDKSERG